MKKYLLYLILLSFCCVACNKPGGSGGLEYNFTFGFDDDPLIVPVESNTDYFFLNAHLKEYKRYATTRYPVYVSEEGTTAIEGVHYVLPEEMMYKFDIGNHYSQELLIAIIPENITEQVNIVFVSEYGHKEDGSYSVRFDQTTVKLVPVAR